MRQMGQQQAGLKRKHMRTVRSYMLHLLKSNCDPNLHSWDAFKSVQTQRDTAAYMQVYVLIQTISLSVGFVGNLLIDPHISRLGKQH